MRNTLLPTEERYALRREYRIRAVAVFAFALMISGIIGIGALFPAFFRAATSRHETVAALDALKKQKTESGLEETEANAYEYSSLLSALDEQKGISYSAVIQSVIGVRGKVQVSSMAISMPDSSKISIALSGTSPSRTDLIAFKGRLGDLVPGSTVDLPISELARSQNVPFRITVVQPKQ